MDVGDELRALRREVEILRAERRLRVGGSEDELMARARELLLQYGWNRCEAGSRRNPRGMCLWVAIEEAAYDLTREVPGMLDRARLWESLYQAGLARACRNIGRHSGDAKRTLVDWDFRPERTLDEVLAALL